MQEENSIREGNYWGDIKGGGLDPVLIWKAREETQYVKKHAVCDKVPIKTGWADTNMETSECLNRSRSATKECNTGPRGDSAIGD